MQLGRVVGRVWSTVKRPSLETQRLLIVQPVTPELAETGRRHRLHSIASAPARASWFIGAGERSRASRSCRRGA